MKTNTAPRQVTTSTTESRAFSMLANSKAFRMLIDGLYENKAQSIVREIWSNALDGHIAAGCKDRPFDVVFPSVYNPVFSVRDYGTSLSHVDIMELYTTVFMSTKEGTNDATGKFGLGSKSPFAYTDTFSVTAYLDGTKRLYTALIAEDGIPHIHFMGEFETDEENGIQVSFPIENKDINLFRQAAMRVSHGFDVKPNPILTEDETFQGWPELDVLLEGKGWKLLRGKIEGYSERAYARMGPVLYPINAEALGDLTAEERTLLGNTFVIDFAMGELDITPSREALSYGPKDPTADSIRARLKTIAKELLESIEKEYKGNVTYWDACIKYVEHTTSAQIPEILKDLMRKNPPVVDGRKVTNVIVLGDPKSAVPFYGTSLQVTTFNPSRVGNSTYRFDYGGGDLKLAPSRDTVLMVEDTTNGPVKKAASRIKQAQIDNQYKTVVWIKFSAGRLSTSTMCALLDYLDGVEVVDVSDLPEPVTVRYGGGGGSRGPVLARTYSHGRFEERVELTEDDYKDGGFFVPLERMNPIVKVGCGSPGTVWSALQACGAIPAGTKLYGAPKSLWKWFEGKQWVNIYDFADKYVSKNLDVERIKLAHKIKAVAEDSFLTKMHRHLGKDTEWVIESPMKTAMDFYTEYTAMKVPPIDGIKRLASAMGRFDAATIDVRKETQEVHDRVQALKHAYPLIEAMDRATYYQNAVLDMLPHYVLSCDKAAAYDSAQDTENAAKAA